MVDKRKPIALIRKTLPEVVEKVDELLETCSDRQVAERLNELGYKSWRAESFTHKKVINIRNAYKLKSRFTRLRERGMLTADELAAQLGVCPTTSTCGDKVDSCANIVTAIYTAVSSNPLAMSSSSRGKVAATVPPLRRLSLFNQPHKVQYETYPLRFGSRMHAGSATTP